MIQPLEGVLKTTAVGAGTYAHPQADYDLFIDVSGAGFSSEGLRAYIEALARDAGLDGTGAKFSLVIPEDLRSLGAPTWATPVPISGTNASNALYRAICQASTLNRHLVVVVGALLPPNEGLRALIDEFDRDPVIGMVQPRFADSSTDDIWSLPGNDRAGEQSLALTRAGLSLLPEYAITPEFLSACFVIRREVVRELGRGELGMGSVTGELRLLLCQTRRRGYRNLVHNRVVFSTSLPRCAIYPGPPNADVDRLQKAYPDIQRADSWVANLSQRKLEAVLAPAYARETKQRRRLLLDCRGMVSQHNGTSHAILGLLDGLQANDGGWEMHAVASPAVVRFFKMQKRYKSFRILTELPGDTYVAAVLLNQPWALSTVAELHNHALLVAFNMLDTISWDILYVCDERLDVVWRFIARFSDAIFYNSHFTRDRFATRFSLCPKVAGCVTYHSFAADEQIDHDALSAPPSDHILIIGNDYDHKDMRRTLQLLVDAFPYNKIVAIGIDRASGRNVTAMPSGQIEERVLQRLFASARVIVMPSFYEGFGMPVVQGLAYGRTVVVRDSLLWREIVAQLRTPGQLVCFDTAASLVEVVGRTLAGLPANALPQGGALGPNGVPLRWKDCAQRIVTTIEELLPSADGRRWQEREEALRSIQLSQS